MHILCNEMFLVTINLSSHELSGDQSHSGKERIYRERQRKGEMERGREKGGSMGREGGEGRERHTERGGGIASATMGYTSPSPIYVPQSTTSQSVSQQSTHYFGILVICLLFWVIEA